MKFPDRSHLGTVTVDGAGEFDVWMVHKAAPVSPDLDALREALDYIARTNPCREFAVPASCLTNDGTGLWCAGCTARAALPAKPDATPEGSDG